MSATKNIEKSGCTGATQYCPMLLVSRIVSIPDKRQCWHGKIQTGEQWNFGDLVLRVSSGGAGELTPKCRILNLEDIIRRGLKLLTSDDSSSKAHTNVAAILFAWRNLCIDQVSSFNSDWTRVKILLLHAVPTCVSYPSRPYQRCNTDGKRSGASILNSKKDFGDHESSRRRRSNLLGGNY